MIMPALDNFQHMGLVAVEAVDDSVGGCGLVCGYIRGRGSPEPRMPLAAFGANLR